jgi:hypothetical protein
MPLLQAETYPDCMKIIREKVYPDRMGEENRKTYEKMWWQFWRPRVELYRKASQYERILFHPFTSKYLLFSFVPVGIVYTAPHILIVTPENYHFAVLQSNFHESWARKYGSTLETRLRYAPSDVFENFPFPKDLLKLEDIGKSYFEHRRQIMLSRQEGLTSTYNRFHNPEEESGDIVRLRELHVEMDRSVASAYGWDDLELGHDFHETAQGIRFTVSESARREVLSRLLRLNHERYEEEQKSKDELGMMNDEKKSKGKRAKKVKSAGDGQMGLL